MSPGISADFIRSINCSIPSRRRFASLERAYEIGKAAGLHYVYLGNVPGTKTEKTYCYKCGKLLIDRIGYRILSNTIKDRLLSGLRLKDFGYSKLITSVVDFKYEDSC